MIVCAGVSVCLYMHLRKSNGEVRKGRREIDPVRGTPQILAALICEWWRSQGQLSFKNSFMLFKFVLSARITLVNRKSVYKNIYVAMSSK